MLDVYMWQMSQHRLLPIPIYQDYGSLEPISPQFLQSKLLTTSHLLPHQIYNVKCARLLSSFLKSLNNVVKRGSMMNSQGSLTSKPCSTQKFWCGDFSILQKTITIANFGKLFGLYTLYGKIMLSFRI